MVISKNVACDGDIVERKRPRKLQNESDSSGNNDSLTVVKKTKKKEYYIRANPLPRILKRDIRREYANFFLNVQNSSDNSLVLRYCDELCVPDCQFTVDLPLAIKFNSTQFKLIQGSENIATNWIHHLSLFPDLLLKLLHPSYDPNKSPESHIIQQEGIKGCKIVFYCVMMGTGLYEDIFHEYLPSSALPSDLQNNEHIHQHCIICHHTQRYGRLCPPINFTSYGNITLYLNEDHRIYRITIEEDKHHPINHTIS